MLQEEKTVQSETVFSGKVFEIHSDKSVIGDDKNLQHREVIVHSGGVAVVAELNDKIIMVKQFRYGAKQILLEIPAGKLDHTNEDILSAAKRELEEETGYQAESWTSLGYIFSTPAICTEKIYLFFAKNLKSGNPHPDEGEIVEHLEIPKEDVFKMVQSGEILDAKTICGLMRAYKL